ncbi:MAG: hypothetical protein WCJ99_07725 [Betaproteobacteria bacterium]|jgi:hypothetical protein
MRNRDKKGTLSKQRSAAALGPSRRLLLVPIKKVKGREKRERPEAAKKVTKRQHEHFAALKV